MNGKVECIMALKSAYNYVRENIDSNFDKYVADNVSYGCEEDIEDIKRWISEEGEDAQVALYYAQHEGAYVFNDFDIYVELIIDMGLILMSIFILNK